MLLLAYSYVCQVLFWVLETSSEQAVSPPLVFSFFSDIYRGVELLGHMVVLFLMFRETSILFSTVGAPIYIPTKSVGGFPVLHILDNICFFVFFLLMSILTGM